MELSGSTVTKLPLTSAYLCQQILSASTSMKMKAENGFLLIVSSSGNNESTYKIFYFLIITYQDLSCDNVNEMSRQKKSLIHRP